VSRYYIGTGPVSAAEQADIAYEQMRLSLVEYASCEAEFAANPNLTPTQEQLIAERRNRWRDRVMVFAAVYHVERDVAVRERKFSGGI
jgi:hypothetical protein